MRQVKRISKSAAVFLSFAIIFAVSAPSVTLGAPIPGTSSSKLVAPQLGLYRSPLGFEISAGGSAWQQKAPPKNSKSMATLYQAPKTTVGSRGTLTVRVDRLKKPLTLQTYIKRWVKEYPKYGFNVIGSKKFSEGNNVGYVLDIINKEKKKQLRQVVYLKDQKAVVMTCRDQAETFKDSLRDCNQIIRSFRWL